MCLVHDIEPCFELCAVKAKPTNNACDFENYWVAGKIKNHLRVFEGHVGRIVKNHEAQARVM